MLNEGVKENGLLLSSVELEDDIEEDIVEEETSSDLDTTVCSSFSSLTWVVWDDWVKENCLLLSSVDEDIVDEEVSPDLDTSLFSSSLAWVEHVWASLTRLSTVVGTWGWLSLANSCTVTGSSCL